MKTSNDDLEELFSELKTLSTQANDGIYGTGLWASWHKLAEAGYQPAKEFFIEKLVSPQFSWRRESVSLLGFHYELEIAVIEKIRHLLSHDSDEVVRMTCATVLGKQGQLPEKALVNSLAVDPDEDVREASFFALLELAHLPYKARIRELKRVKSHEINPSLDEVKRILSDENLLDSLDSLNKS